MTDIEDMHKAVGQCGNHGALETISAHATKRNVEIKFVVSDLEPVRAAARLALLSAKGDGGSYTVRQIDTYFESGEPGVRKKVRQMFSLLSEEDVLCEPELITYSRPDADIRTSTYSREPINIRQEDAFLGLGTAICVVDKEREVILLGRTRVHLDTVSGLEGHFVELEVVLCPDESEEAGCAEAERITEQLGLKDAARCKGSYLDLVLAQPALLPLPQCPNSFLNTGEANRGPDDDEPATPLPHCERRPNWLVSVTGEYPDPEECEDRMRQCSECGEDYDSWNPHLSCGDDYCYDCQMELESEYLDDQ